MEEEQGSYQAEESNQETQQESAETVTTQETAPTGISIKYNGADEIVSYEEAPTWIQKGKNYDKVAERAKEAETYQQSLNRIAKFYGYDNHSEYMTALEQAEQEKMIEIEAEKYQVPEEFIRQELQPLKSELDKLKSEREQFQQAELRRQVDSEVAEMTKNYPDFDGMKEEVFKFATEHSMKLDQAYKLLTYDTRIETAAKAKEQEVIARLTGRDNKQVLSSTDAPNNVQFDPANMSFAEIGEISKRVQRGERITF